MSNMTPIESAFREAMDLAKLWFPQIGQDEIDHAWENSEAKAYTESERYGMATLPMAGE